jgi:hypothetical protein
MALTEEGDVLYALGIDHKFVSSFRFPHYSPILGLRT